MKYREKKCLEEVKYPNLEIDVMKSEVSKSRHRIWQISFSWCAVSFFLRGNFSVAFKQSSLENLSKF